MPASLPAPPQTQVPSRAITRSNTTTRRKRADAPPVPLVLPTSVPTTGGPASSTAVHANQTSAPPPMTAGALLASKTQRPAAKPHPMPMPFGVDPADLVRRLQIVADKQERDDKVAAQNPTHAHPRPSGPTNEQAELAAWHASRKGSTPSQYLSRHASARRRPAPVLNGMSAGTALSPPASAPALVNDATTVEEDVAQKSLRRSKSRAMKDGVPSGAHALGLSVPPPMPNRSMDAATSNAPGTNGAAVTSSTSPQLNGANGASAPGSTGLAPPNAIPFASIKVYVVTRQRYVHVDCRADARAKELVQAVLLKTNVGQTEDHSAAPGAAWVVWDVSPRWGVERPLREYERISDTQATRADGADYFLLRRTELASVLSARSVPPQSPVLAGWVHVYTYAKAKWNRKWLELRDHGLYVAKSTSGKDSTFLCSLGTFDAYLFSPSVADSSLCAGVSVPKPAKSYSFAVRSQDRPSLFEKPEQDYVHYFSLSDPAAHRDWIKNILLARTYLLAQDHPHLIASIPATSASLSRSGTTRKPWGAREPSSPIANGPPPPLPTSPSKKGQPPPLVRAADLFRGPFVPGSLLGNQQDQEALPQPNVPRNWLPRPNAR